MILVAGIGNIFLGDDAFGVEVVKQLSRISFPENIHIKDFGIRGFDLAFALTDHKYESAILVDAMPRGGSPGSLYAIQADVKKFSSSGELPVDTHGMNPMKVFELVNALGGASMPVFIVGCEPKSFGREEEGSMDMSEPVRSAIPGAISMIQNLISKMMRGQDA